MHDNFCRPVWTFLHFLFNLLGEPVISLTSERLWHPCVSSLVLDNVHRFRRDLSTPQAKVSKGLVWASSEVRRGALGNSENESVMMYFCWSWTPSSLLLPSSSSLHLCQAWHSGSVASVSGRLPPGTAMAPCAHVLMFRRRPCP